MTIEQIFEEIYTKDSEWDVIMCNILGRNGMLQYKDDLISILAYYWIASPTKVVEVYKKSRNQFKGYFITSVKNQVNSTTSKLYNECIFKDNYSEALHHLDTNYDMPNQTPEFTFVTNKTTAMTDEELIDSKIETEQRHQIIEHCIKHTKGFKWFDVQMFREFWYIEDGKKSHQAIADEYGINKCSVYNAEVKVRKAIIEQIKKQFGD